MLSTPQDINLAPIQQKLDSVGKSEVYKCLVRTCLKGIIKLDQEVQL